MRMSVTPYSELKKVLYGLSKADSEPMTEYFVVEMFVLKCGAWQESHKPSELLLLPVQGLHELCRHLGLATNYAPGSASPKSP